MKKSIFFLTFLVYLGMVSAQQAPKYRLNTAKDIVSFIQETENPSERPEAMRPTLSLKLNTGLYFDGIINLKRDNNGTSEIIGNDVNNPEATFFLMLNKKGEVSGKYISPKNKEVIIYSTDKNTGTLITKKEDINSHICVDYGSSELSDKNYPKTASRPVPVLESLPEAEAVIYLDFDGEVSTSRWNGGRTIDAKSFDYSDEVIELHWKITAEDFRPFQVNVTTNRASYDKAPKNKRIMCIITPTKTAAPNAGGVAYLNSFSDGSDDPCWVFITDQTKGSGEVASHEVGHTLGLDHDGDNKGAYYLGHNDWGPIMGACHRLKTVHWSKGEYPNANNRQDDLQVIIARNGFGYRTDIVGDDTNNAEDMVVETNGEILPEKNEGIIEKTNDKDVFKFTVSKKGKVDLKIIPFHHHPNLDVLARLLDDAGKEIAKSNPEDDMSGSFSQELEAGTYFVEIDGTGKGNLQTGYSEYGSIGTYNLSGTIPAGGELPKAIFSADKLNICAGQEVQFTDESTGDPTKWEWKFENGSPATSDKQNPKITYSKSGKHKVELTITNDNGSDTKTEEAYIVVSEPKVLPVKEGFEDTFPADGWVVENTDNDITWEKSTETGFDSKSCLMINNANYQKIGEKDVLLAPETDFSGGNNDPSLTFFVAYTRFNDAANDKLRVYVSDDCGEKWTQVYLKEKKDLETKDVPFDESQEWVPEKLEDWRKEMVSLAQYKGKKSVKIKFESTNGYGNNIWIDNVNIDYVSGIKTATETDYNLIVAPNPTHSEFNFGFTSPESADYTIKISNILGKVMYTQKLQNHHGMYTKKIDCSNYAEGIYLLSIESSKGFVVEKIIKE